MGAVKNKLIESMQESIQYPEDFMHSTAKVLKPFNRIEDISPRQADLICSTLGSALLKAKDELDLNKALELKELHERFLLTLIQVVDRENWTTNLKDPLKDSMSENQELV